jgi:hypothetical protein
MTVSAVPRIIVANGSLRAGGFRERVLAAREAGFDGFGMHVATTPTSARRDGPTPTYAPCCGTTGST